METFTSIIFNSLQILGIAIGGPTMILGLMHMFTSSQHGMKRVLFGMALVTLSLAIPDGWTNQLPPVDQEFLNKIA